MGILIFVLAICLGIMLIIIAYLSGKIETANHEYDYRFLLLSFVLAIICIGFFAYSSQKCFSKHFDSAEYKMKIDTTYIKVEQHE